MWVRSLANIKKSKTTSVAIKIFYLKGYVDKWMQIILNWHGQYSWLDVLTTSYEYLNPCYTGSWQNSTKVSFNNKFLCYLLNRYCWFLLGVIYPVPTYPLQKGKTLQDIITRNQPWKLIQPICANITL